MSDLNARLRAAANQSIAASEILAPAGNPARSARAGSGDLDRRLREAHYAVIARERAGAIRLDPAFVDRLRRDYDGPIDLGGVDLSQGQSVVVVEDGPTRVYTAAFGAVAAVIHWLAGQMAPAEEPASEEPAAAEA